MMPAPRVARGLPSTPPETRSSSPLAVHIRSPWRKQKESQRLAATPPVRRRRHGHQRITSTHTRIPQCASAPGVYAHACAGFSDNLTTVMIAYLPANPSSRKFLERRAEPDSSAATPDAGSSTGASSTSAGAGWSRRRMGLGFANPNAAGSHWISTQFPTRTRPAAIRSPRRLSTICKTREPSSAPAKRRRRHRRPCPFTTRTSLIKYLGILA